MGMRGEEGDVYRPGDAHHVAFDKVEAEWDLLDRFVQAVDALFAVSEDDV